MTIKQTASTLRAMGEGLTKVELSVPSGREELARKMLADPHYADIVLDCYDIYCRKGDDYTRGLGEESRLDNFYKAAENSGISVPQAWNVYFYKHVAAVWAYVRMGQVQSEPIESRLHDIINYAVLLLEYVELQNNDVGEPGG